MPPIVFADLRCLQNPAYRTTSRGQHALSILRSRKESICRDWPQVALLDDCLEQLPRACGELVDEVSYSLNSSITKRGAVFLDFAPIGYDHSFNSHYTFNPGFSKAAIVYDSPLLESVALKADPLARLNYLGSLARLRSFELYLAVSNHAAQRLADVIGAPSRALGVSGAVVRDSFYAIRERERIGVGSGANNNPYFLFVGSRTSIDELETVLAAVRAMNQPAFKGVLLKVAGQYSAKDKQDLLRQSAHAGSCRLLEFVEDLNETALALTCANSIATIVASDNDDLSFQLARAAVCGTAVLSSKPAAHHELLSHDGCIFDPEDPGDLANRLGRLLEEPRWRAELIASSGRIVDDFKADRVGARFWDAINARFSGAGQSLKKKRTKPKIAFLTPYPPEQSGVARYSELTIRAAAPRIDIDLFTNAPRPIVACGFRDAGPIQAEPILKGDYDAVISVVGNSGYHVPILDLFEQYGGPCILHDSRLIQVYSLRFGQKRFAEFATRLLGRSVTKIEIEGWLQDRDLPSLFVEPIVKRARPLIVHTRQYQRQLLDRYGVHAEVTTCCPNSRFTSEELSEPARRAARAAIGVSSDDFLIATFGFVSKVKGLEACIKATALLRSWKIPARLHFVGDVLGQESEVVRLAKESGVTADVHWRRSFVDETIYRNFLVAADVAVQLRAYGMGHYSAALGDCISAGIPTVATGDLAAACDAPEYVATIPDHQSTSALADRLAEIWAGGRRRRESEARDEYLSVHNFSYYVKRLTEVLDLPHIGSLEKS